ncbi:hypothetical protein [Vibrio cortegadensis]|uniref:Uncharacterized protein n=1 Tax=Vibrio cortegadensis TaxID=1328770 RepID=A0ABV4M2P6_9VIBR
MNNWFHFEWVFISWIISLFIHHHNIKRNSVSDKIDELITQIAKLSERKWCDDDDHAFYNEERYNAHLSRIRWKVTQLNQLAACILVHDEKLKLIYNFDIEAFLDSESTDKIKRRLKFELQDDCTSLIEHIEENHFKKVLRSKTFIFWSARYTCAGILFGLVTVYLFIQIMSFFYN